MNARPNLRRVTVAVLAGVAFAAAPAAFARTAGLSTPMLDFMGALAIRQARDKGLYLG